MTNLEDGVIDTEHILLGITDLAWASDDNIAVQVLKALNVDLGALRWKLIASRKKCQPRRNEVAGISLDFTEAERVALTEFKQQVEQGALDLRLMQARMCERVARRLRREVEISLAG